LRATYGRIDEGGERGKKCEGSKKKEGAREARDGVVYCKCIQKESSHKEKNNQFMMQVYVIDDMYNDSSETSFTKGILKGDIIRNPLKRAMISKSKSTQLHNTIGMKKEEPRNQ